MDQVLLNKISTASALIPIAFCLLAISKKAKDNLWLFLWFLLIGFIVDCMGWYQYVMHNYSPVFDQIRRFYSLIEAFFFIWYLTHLRLEKTKQLIIYGAYLTIPLWVFFEWVIPTWLNNNQTVEIAYFQAIYRVFVATLAIHNILRMIEVGTFKTTFSQAWLVSAILIYSFSTFFVMILQRFDLAEKVWYLHNVMNIITYMIYSIGFFTHFRKSRSLISTRN